ncbi:AMP-binding protein [Novosphingobium colocasiae]
MFSAFQRSAAQHGELLAIRDGATRVTYGSLLARVRVLARALMAQGIAKGDRIAIWAVNHAPWIETALAIQAAGGVLVPLSTRLRGGEVAAVLERSEARLLFCDAGFGPYDFPASLAECDLPELGQIITFAPVAAAKSGVREVISLDTFASQAAPVLDEALDARIASILPDDWADMLFTSGTTGLPKGVPMTQRQSLIACHQQQVDICHFEPGDVFPVIFPFAHNAGYRAGWQASLLYGVTVVPVRASDPAELLDLFSEVRATYVPAVPTVFQSIIDNPRLPEFDLSSIRLAAVGGTDVPVELVRAMQSRLGVQAVVAGYGMTEAAGSITSCRAGDPPDVVANTAGSPLSNLEVVCLDDELRPVARNVQGQIAVRGPQVLKAYYSDDAATAASFTADGFFLTGDVGILDDAGNLRITDRLKDMYLCGGFNVYPAEVERVMRGIAGVADVAVVGVADSRLGQVGRAFVVPRGPDLVTAAAVVAFCKDNLANYKVPRFVTFIDELPRNAVGKVQKAELRAYPDHGSPRQG